MSSLDGRTYPVDETGGPGCTATAIGTRSPRSAPRLIGVHQPPDELGRLTRRVAKIEFLLSELLADFKKDR